MTALSLQNPFWKYSLQRYAQSTIQESCLALQNKFNCDVNFVLLADWLGSQQIILDPNVWEMLEKKHQNWTEQVVKPLRTMRNHLNKADENEQPLREAIKNCELQAEQISQAKLFDSISAYLQAGVDGLREHNQQYCKAGNFENYMKGCQLQNDTNAECMTLFKNLYY